LKKDGSKKIGKLDQRGAFVLATTLSRQAHSVFLKGQN